MPKRHTAKSTSRPASKKKEAVDAIQLLKADHRKVEELFNQFMNGNSAGNQSLAEQIFRELRIHSILEEELFYPMLQGRSASINGDIGNILHEDMLDIDEQDEADCGDFSQGTITSAYDEHRMMQEQIKQLLQMNASDSEFRPGMVELQEIVIAHVSIEEEELFPYAHVTFDTHALGGQMLQRKSDILSPVA